MPLIETRLADLEYKRYFEPFLGGGAFFFYFGAKPAFLSDLNEDLVNTYEQVRDHPDGIVRELKKLNVDASTFATVRERVPSTPLGRAVRFLFLNRTAFSGIYRVNRRGQYNVPFGGGDRTAEPLWRDGILSDASRALKGVTLGACDFGGVLKSAKQGDLVYCDPTYTVTHNDNGFRKYNESCFSWTDQVHLAKACQAAAGRGATVVVSNAYHREIESLYHGFQTFVVERKSLLSADATARKSTREYVFISR